MQVPSALLAQPLHFPPRLNYSNLTRSSNKCLNVTSNVYFQKTTNRTMKFLHIILLLSILGSCSSDYYSIEDFKHVKKIDTHMHLNAEQLALAQQAEEIILSC
jgi:hypothetical protein